ncbi:MAG: hypothetical protein ACP5RO_07770, partial [Fervidicoccaceae archaeon]
PSLGERKRDEAGSITHGDEPQFLSPFSRVISLNFRDSLVEGRSLFMTFGMVFPYGEAGC